MEQQPGGKTQTPTTGGGAKAGALRRFLRWNPANHWQVWLICALPLFLVWLIGEWVFLGQPLIGLVFGSTAAIASGAVQSYRLGQRRDAATTAEWTSARHGAPPGS